MVCWGIGSIWVAQVLQPQNWKGVAENVQLPVIRISRFLAKTVGACHYGWSLCFPLLWIPPSTDGLRTHRSNTIYHRKLEWLNSQDNQPTMFCWNEPPTNLRLTSTMHDEWLVIHKPETTKSPTQLGSALRNQPCPSLLSHEKLRIEKEPTNKMMDFHSPNLTWKAHNLQNLRRIRHFRATVCGAPTYINSGSGWRSHIHFFVGSPHGSNSFPRSPCVNLA